MAREKQGRNASSTFLIVDAQSVKNTDTAALKGYDAGKKVSGIKRHIAVDTQGLPHAVAVTTAEVTDRNGALRALQRCKCGLKRVQSLLCDSGYVGQPFAQGVKDILAEHVTVQIAKRSELHTFKVMPQRWVVERSFAWLEKNRRLWKNCERLLSKRGLKALVAGPRGAGQHASICKTVDIPLSGAARRLSAPFATASTSISQPSRLGWSNRPADRAHRSRVWRCATASMPICCVTG